jgi:hypothetical protein
MAEQQPFFAEMLQRVAPDGRIYSGFGGSRAVRFFADRIELDSIRIYPPYLKDLRSGGNTLRVRFVTADGQTVEEHLRLQGWTAARRLAEAVAAVTWMAATAIEAPEAPEAPEASEASGASPGFRVESWTDGRTMITVPSYKLAFPLACPVCGEKAVRLSPRVGGKVWKWTKWLWLVPVCGRHEVDRSIVVERWGEETTEISLSFASASYARRFFEANQSPRPLGDLFGRDLDPAGFSGISFILYDYTLAGYRSLSRVHALRPGEGRVGRGMGYNLVTLVLGWWSPRGVVWSLRSLAGNLRGGHDVTEDAKKVLSGIALSAYHL